MYIYIYLEQYIVYIYTHIYIYTYIYTLTYNMYKTSSYNIQTKYHCHSERCCEDVAFPVACAMLQVNDTAENLLHGDGTQWTTCNNHAMPHTKPAKQCNYTQVYASICKYMQIYANILQRFITRPTLAKNPWTRHRCPEVLFWLWQINPGLCLARSLVYAPFPRVPLDITCSCCPLFVICCLFILSEEFSSQSIYPHVATVWQCNVLAQVHHVHLPSKVPSLCWCFITWHFR